jgi:Leucine-rich repeat (LRR) protein
MTVKQPRRSRVLWCILAASCWGLGLVGCPSPLPRAQQAPKAGDSADKSELKEDPEAIAALVAAGANLRKDSEGHVVAVELDRDHGSDAELKFLSGLPYVRELGADVRGVTDAGLAVLAGHPNLRVLRLERSSVTDAGMAHLKKLPRLEDLDLKRTAITVEGYRHVGQIPTLKRLRVVYNARFNDDCCLAIKDLKQLELLDLQDCNQPTEKGLVILQGFPKLRHLRLWGPNINDRVLSYLRGAKELRVLSLEQCTGVTADGLEHIRGLTNLTEVALFGATGLNDAAIAKLSGLTKMQKLDLRQLPITSLALSYLKDMKDLRVLDLSETAAVGNEGLEHIRGLTNLEDLNLWSCQIDDGGLVHLAGMKKLKRLNLDKCNITDEGLKHLAGLTNLEYLHLGSTQVTDAGLEHLQGLKNLRHLVVTFLPGVTREGIERLEAALPSLEEIEQ